MRPLTIALTLCLSILLATQAQAQPQPRSVDEVIAALKQLPPGTAVDLTVEGANGSGVGVTTTGDKIDQSLQTSAPIVSLPDGGGASGGGSTSRIKVWGATIQPAAVALAIVGVLCWVGAVLSIVLKWGVPRAPLILGPAGAAFIAASIWITAAPYVIGAIFLVVVAAWIWVERSHTQKDAMLTAVTRGVSDAEHDQAAPDAQSAAALVKSYIVAHTPDALQTAIRGFRRAKDIK